MRTSFFDLENRTEMTTSQPKLSHPKYRADIDGLRAIAVLCVVVFHAFPNLMQGGFVGVDVFFVISGFLISSIIFENLDRGTFSFAEFYARRIKRIFPALTLVLITCLVFGWFALLPDELNQLGKHIVAGAGFVSNLVLWSEAGYFDNSAETKPLLHLWSLGIEEQFYIVWPLLLWLAWKRNINLLLLTALVASASFALNIKGIHAYPVATFYSPLTRFWELLCGTILAWYSLYKNNLPPACRELWDNALKRYPLKIFRLNSARSLPNLFAFSGVMLLAISCLAISKKSSFPGYWAILPVLAATLIILAGPETWLNRRILSHKILVWFGLISFPLYLWHWPILSFGRIMYFDPPPTKFRLIAVAASILLAWLTVKFIEKPLRFGSNKTAIKITALTSLILLVAIVGAIVNKSDFSKSHTFEKLSLKRKGEHAIGSSLAWYRGKDNWLFLGNAYENTVAKLKLAIIPSESQLNATKESFSNLATVASKHHTKVALIVGPNKSSIYPEYLPDEIKPSAIKYSDLFLDKLKNIPNLYVYNPTNDFISKKSSEGYLYWKTDTHWNNRGAFLAFSGFLKSFDLPVPKVSFKNSTARSGDLVEISKLKDFPLNAEDNWDLVWNEEPQWTENEVPNEQETPFGTASVVINDRPLSNLHVWVVGDSFTGALKQYFNVTFKEVRYVGHLGNKLNELPDEFSNAKRKPDLVVIVKVERSF